MIWNSPSASNLATSKEFLPLNGTLQPQTEDAVQSNYKPDLTLKDPFSTHSIQVSENLTENVKLSVEKFVQSLQFAIEVTVADSNRSTDEMPRNENALLRAESRASSIPKPLSNYICASRYAVPKEIENVCVISQGREIDEDIVTHIDNDMFIARLDRMSPNEQLILKCASVLGMTFTRELLSAIVPRKTASVFDNTLYRLSKERLIECGSLALYQSQVNSNDNSNSFRKLSGIPSNNHHTQENKPNQVLCGCYANEGTPTINLSHIVRHTGGKKKLCLYFQFTSTLLREAAYNLWLEEQRHALHERAAIFLENQTHLCKSCGGTSFVPGRKSMPSKNRSFSIRELGT